MPRKIPIEKINNPKSDWLNSALLPVQSKKPFLIITTMIYVCNEVTPNHQIKKKILDLIATSPNLPIYKLGFFNNWQKHPIWN
jgi:abortive infection bacteriophage resistance protein